MLVLYLPLGLVFQITPVVASVYALMFQFFAFFPHMNVRLEMGPLSRVVLGPQVHRIHHSIYQEHFNTNFAGAFPIWDLVFGTYRAPARGEFPPTGVPHLPGRPSLTQTVLWPFMIAERDTASDPRL
jgi:sterol desaturase/sphingolipid hydroxylase (fatty acid hydroxylase superfamily)